MTWRRKLNRDPRAVVPAWIGTEPNRVGGKFAVPKERSGNLWQPRNLAVMIRRPTKYVGSVKCRPLPNWPHVLPDSELSSVKWHKIPGFETYDIALTKGWIQNHRYKIHLNPVYQIDATGERVTWLRDGKGEYQVVRLADIHTAIKLGPRPSTHCVRFRDFNPENWQDIENLDYVLMGENQGIIPKQFRKKYKDILSRKDLMILAQTHPEAARFYRQSALSAAQESDIKSLVASNLMTPEQAGAAYKISLAVINKLLDIKAPVKVKKEKRKMTEARFWGAVKNALDMVEWTRIENTATSGVADVFGAIDSHSFWIELKVTDTNKVYVRPSQRAWFARYGSTKLCRFVLVRRDDWIYLFHAADVAWLCKYGINKTWCVWKSKRPYDWQWLLQCLMDQEAFIEWTDSANVIHRKKAWNDDKLVGQMTDQRISMARTIKPHNKWWEKGKKVIK